ncbi:Dabb family protein [bacterium]|nr:Dabb family protein [bacterium]
MIKHIVMWTLKEKAEGKSKQENISLLRDRLEALPELIPEIQFYEVGLNISKSDSAYDMVLISHFADQQDLKAYQEHPDHVKVAEFVSRIRDQGAVVDFEI